jgi:thiol-disulfide isomerase/thioredoxin
MNNRLNHAVDALYLSNIYYMKHAHLAILAILFLLTACQNNATDKTTVASKDTSFVVHGNITGLDSGYVYLLNYQNTEKGPDSAKLSHGLFTFTGKADSPNYYLLGIKNNGQLEYRSGFFAENTSINISGNKDSASNLSVTGGPVEAERKLYMEGRKKLEDEGNMLSELYDSLQTKKDQKGVDSVVKLFNTLEKRSKDWVRHFAKDHPASYVSAFEVYQSYSYNPDAKELDTLYNGLSADIRASYFGRKLSRVLETAKKTDIGNIAPDFSQADVKGKTVSLSSLRNKYVLLDFWASWCGPCRAENPSVVRAYKKYHPKGFDILSVSLDDDKDKWMEAIKKDHLAWQHVSDLKGWKNSVAAQYGIQGIPMNFLLDKEGKIIAKGLRGEDLDKKLEEIMK